MEKHDFFSKRKLELFFDDLNNVVNEEEKQIWELFEDFFFFEKTQSWIFVKKWSDARADDIFCFSQNSKIF